MPLPLRSATPPAGPSTSGRDACTARSPPALVAGPRPRVLALPARNAPALRSAIAPSPARRGCVVHSGPAAQVISTALLAGPSGWLLALAASVFAGAVAFAVVLAVPVVAEVVLALREVRALVRDLRKELPETAAVLRLTSLEAADCIEEYAGLGMDLTAGLRSSARLVSSAEQGIRTAPAQVAGAVRKSVVPGLRQVLETRLKASAELRNTRDLLRKAKATAEVTRATLAGAETARRVAPYVQGMQGTVSQVREALGRNVGGRRNGAGVDMGVEADAAGA